MKHQELLQVWTALILRAACLTWIYAGYNVKKMHSYININIVLQFELIKYKPNAFIYF